MAEEGRMNYLEEMRREHTKWLYTMFVSGFIIGLGVMFIAGKMMQPVQYTTPKKVDPGFDYPIHETLTDGTSIYIREIAHSRYHVLYFPSQGGQREGDLK